MAEPEHDARRPLGELEREFGTDALRRVIEQQLISVWSDARCETWLDRNAVLAALLFRVPKAQALAALDHAHPPSTESPQTINTLYPALRTYFPGLGRRQLYRYVQEHPSLVRIEHGPQGKPIYRARLNELRTALERDRAQQADDRELYAASLARLPVHLRPSSVRARAGRGRPDARHSDTTGKDRP